MKVNRPPVESTISPLGVIQRVVVFSCSIGRPVVDSSPQMSKTAYISWLASEGRLTTEPVFPGNIRIFSACMYERTLYDSCGARVP